MKKYYTILLGNDIYENVIDDMNTTEIWAEGGMLWKSKKKAIACLKKLKGYDIETDKKKLSVKQMYF